MRLSVTYHESNPWSSAAAENLTAGFLILTMPASMFNSLTWQFAYGLATAVALASVVVILAG